MWQSPLTVSQCTMPCHHHRPFRLLFKTHLPTMFEHVSSRPAGFNISKVMVVMDEMTFPSVVSKMPATPLKEAYRPVTRRGVGIAPAKSGKGTGVLVVPSGRSTTTSLTRHFSPLGGNCLILSLMMFSGLPSCCYSATQLTWMMCTIVTEIGLVGASCNSFAGT